MGYFPVRYDSRVVIYDHRGFIRLATANIKYIKLHVIVGQHGFLIIYLTIYLFLFELTKYTSELFFDQNSIINASLIDS